MSNIKKVFAVFAAFVCAFLVAHSAQAQDMPFGIDNAPNIVGIGGGMLPDYIGSDDYTGGAAPFFKYTPEKTEYYVMLMATQLYVNVANNPNFRLGPTLNYRFGRDDDVDDDFVKEMEEIDGAIEAGAFVGYEWRDPQNPLHPPVIMISGHGTIEVAVKATQSGAYDFLEKPLSLERVLLSACRALERGALERENRDLKDTLARKWHLIGESAAIKKLQAEIEMAAQSSSRVLITGESGSGKELVARLLHNMSSRAHQPFVEVNCAAIPHELIESEPSDMKRGLFGALEKRRGKFELADRGTLFLDEIGDMSRGRWCCSTIRQRCQLWRPPQMMRKTTCD